MQTKKIIPIKNIGFALTNRCDLHCKICQIWQENPKKDLALSTIKKCMPLLKLPFFTTLTGGEPFLAKKFDDIYFYFYELYLKKQVYGINISTNAYSNKIVEFLKFNKKIIAPLSINISFDGMLKNHNKQRGKNDAFQKTLNNILKIKKFPIPLTLKFILSDTNYQDLWNVYTLSKRIGCQFKINLISKIPNYYHKKKTFIQKTNFAKNKKQLILEQIRKIKKKSPANNDLSLALSLFHIKWLLTGIGREQIKKYFIKQKVSNSLFVTPERKIYNCIYKNPVGEISSKKVQINWHKILKIKQTALQSNSRKYLSPYSYLRQI